MVQIFVRLFPPDLGLIIWTRTRPLTERLSLLNTILLGRSRVELWRAKAAEEGESGEVLRGGNQLTVHNQKNENAVGNFERLTESLF